MADKLSVAVHDRTWTVDDSGIAVVEIRLSDVEVYERCDITLATLVPPYCAYRAHGPVDCDGSPFDVHTDDPNPPGSGFDVGSLPVSFTFTALPGKYATIGWSYCVSGAVPYQPADQFFPPENYWQTDSKRKFIRSYELRIPCKKLTLKLEFKSEAVFTHAQGLIEQRMVEPRLHWKGVGTLNVRHDARPPTKGRTAVLSVENPTLGQRYGIELTCDAIARHTADHVLRLADRVRTICRDEHVDETGLRRALNEALSRMLAKQWPQGNRSDERDRTLVRVSATGHLWNSQDQVLEAAYGICPVKHFGVCFKFGCGVAGHAFRFAKCAGLRVSRRENGEYDDSSLLYQNILGHAHDWVVCIPILAGPGGVCVGVVSFSGVSEVVTRAERTLYSLAASPNTTAAARLFASLLYSVSAAFWEALFDPRSALSDEEQMEARGLFERFDPRGSASYTRELGGEPLASDTTRTSDGPGKKHGEEADAESEDDASERLQQSGQSSDGHSLTPREIRKSAIVDWWSRWQPKEQATLITALIAAVAALGAALVNGALQSSPPPVKSEPQSQAAARPAAPAAPAGPTSSNAPAPPHRMSTEEVVQLLGRGSDGFHEFQQRKARDELPSLQNLDLCDLRIPGAPFGGLNFLNSKMDGINLDGANLNDANLAGVKLRFGSGGVRATLKRAQLQKTDLTNAEFEGTDFSGANLASATGLVQIQLNHACGDAETRLPANLTIPLCIK